MINSVRFFAGRCVNLNGGEGRLDIIRGSRDRHCRDRMEQSANKIEPPSRIAWAAGIVGALLLMAVAVILAGDVAFRLRSE